MDDSEIEFVGEDFDDVEFLPSRNFATEINTILSIHKETNTQNAIVLNRNMQNMLIEMQIIVTGMLQKCQDKYQKNEEYLTISMGGGTFNSTKHLKTYSICGIPFFKNISNCCAPHNSDYLYRCNVQKEFFPVDIFVKKNANWTLRDKINTIKGVKNQAIEYLKDKNNKFALETKCTRKLKESTHKKNDEVKTLLLVDLLEKTDDNFHINWFRLSSFELDNRHTEASCEAMWKMFLYPKLNRSKWSNDETEKLTQLVRKYNFSNWSNIANKIGNRSEYQCYIHYITVISEHIRIRKDKWTKEDDDILIEAVEKSRMGSVIRWNIVQQYFPDRNKKQLNTRYCYSLDPKIKKGKFTKEEDCIIIAAIQKYGENFSTMPIALFPGRNIIQIRNRYNNTLKYINKHKKWSVEDDEKLLDFVKVNGKTEWSKISSEFGYHTRTSCRQRYTTIIKYLKKYPSASLQDIPRKYKQIKSDITVDNWEEKISDLVSCPDENYTNSMPQTKQPYSQKLRSLDKEYYDFFKYSYDYKLNAKHFIIYNPISNLNYLINLLDIDFKKTKIIKEQKKFNSNELKLMKMLLELRKDKSKIKKFDSEENLPPSWPTVLGLRGICIQCTSESVKPVTPTNKTKKIYKETTKGIKAKQKFKERFRALFYNTILLSRIDADSVTIPEQYPQNVNLGLKEMQESLKKISTMYKEIKIVEENGENNNGIMNQIIDIKKYGIPLEKKDNLDNENSENLNKRRNKRCDELSKVSSKKRKCLRSGETKNRSPKKIKIEVIE